MATITPQYLIDNLKGAQGLPEEDVKKWMDRLGQMTELDLETFEEYKQFLQDALDKKFAEAGVELDENDPEYQTAFKDMQNEVKAAKEEYDKGIEELNKEAKKVEQDAMKQIDQVDIQAAQDKIKAAI